MAICRQAASLCYSKLPLDEVSFKKGINGVAQSCRSELCCLSSHSIWPQGQPALPFRGCAFVHPSRSSSHLKYTSHGGSHMRRIAQEIRIPRASTSSEGSGDQESGRNAESRDPSAGGASEQGASEAASDSSKAPNFASDSAGVSNLRPPQIAVVDEESIGGSRFDVARRAMKGDFDPPKASEVCLHYITWSGPHCFEKCERPDGTLKKRCYKYQKLWNFLKGTVLPA